MDNIKLCYLYNQRRVSIYPKTVFVKFISLRFENGKWICKFYGCFFLKKNQCLTVLGRWTSQRVVTVLWDENPNCLNGTITLSTPDTQTPCHHLCVPLSCHSDHPPELALCPFHSHRHFYHHHHHRHLGAIFIPHSLPTAKGQSSPLHFPSCIFFSNLSLLIFP